MPVFYKIDQQRRLVLSTGFGILTREDLAGHQERLQTDPDFDPGFSHLADITHVTKLDLDANDVSLLAQPNIFSSTSRRAFVVKDDFQFGLAKMFESLRVAAGERGVRVFRNLEDGLDWIFGKHATP